MNFNISKLKMYHKRHLWLTLIPLTIKFRGMFWHRDQSYARIDWQVVREPGNSLCSQRDARGSVEVNQKSLANTGMESSPVTGWTAVVNELACKLAPLSSRAYVSRTRSIVFFEASCFRLDDPIAHVWCVYRLGQIIIIHYRNIFIIYRG